MASEPDWYISWFCFHLSLCFNNVIAVAGKSENKSEVLLFLVFTKEKYTYLLLVITQSPNRESSLECFIYKVKKTLTPFEFAESMRHYGI